MRIAISTIAFERGLFSEDCFEDKTLMGVDIKSLSNFEDNSSQLLAWLEEGVFEALEKQFLKKLIMNFHEDEDCVHAPYETYECAFLVTGFVRSHCGL